jgi:hypothetical protein
MWLTVDKTGTVLQVQQQPKRVFLVTTQRDAGLRKVPFYYMRIMKDLT